MSDAVPPTQYEMVLALLIERSPQTRAELAAVIGDKAAKFGLIHARNRGVVSSFRSHYTPGKYSHYYLTTRGGRPLTS